MLDVMNQSVLPQYILDDLNRFISNYYQEQIPYSLIVAQEFLSSFQYFGKDVSLSKVIDAVEYIRVNSDF